MIARDSKVALSTGTPLPSARPSAVWQARSSSALSRASLPTARWWRCPGPLPLGLITVGTLLYTVNKAKISTRQITSKLFCVVVGLMLGIMSSFLGLWRPHQPGGAGAFVQHGQQDLPRANSLYIILFSQLASLIATLISGVPEFRPLVLILMVAGGTGGGIVGRALEQEDGQPGGGQTVHCADGCDHRHLHLQCIPCIRIKSVSACAQRLFLSSGTGENKEGL